MTEPVDGDRSLTLPSASESGFQSRPRRQKAVSRLPEVSEELFGFRLRHELGRGAYARVFLAEQAELAGRPVVLKVSAIEGTEPQTLAQLQHTHIVPVYSVHEDGGAGLRALCMPYFGGASLSQVLHALWKETDRPTRGEQLVRALVAVSSEPPVSDSVADPPPDPPPPVGGGQGGGGGASAGPTPLDLLKAGSYVRAAAWIVARLAEALQHAHERGVLHRDIKPSNVLLAADGQPLLLDFNVAENVKGVQAQKRAVLGGTVAYMAPEHLRAIANRDPVQAAQVDRRSDVYSLGMVLYELLTGCSPFDQSGSYSPMLPVVLIMAMERGKTVPSLRVRRPDVPWGLESIVRKCLAPDPSARYQRAEDLAEDLRRFLADQPLKFAPELSRVERLQKWARRHPRLTYAGAVASLAALLLGAAGAALADARGDLASTHARLEVAQSQDKRRAFEEGTVRALCLVNTTTDLYDHLREGVTVCEKTLGLYGILDRDDWQDGADWRRLNPEERERLGRDARELVLLLAWARDRTGARDAESARAALALLDRAQAIRGLSPSRALWEDRAAYLERLGDAAAVKAARAEVARLKPEGARDHYMLATAYARSGRYPDAVAELNRALTLNSRHYWSWVQRGICYQEMGKNALAAADFSVCIGLWPEFAWGHFNRACALDRSGNRVEAIRDYSAALERDPNFLLPYVNRGLARLELKQYAPALADFDKAAALGRDDAVLHTGRGVALEGLGRHKEADAAFAAASQRSATATAEVRRRLRWVYGFAVAGRLPGRAREAFDEVLRERPAHPQALYGRAMLLAQAGQLDEAIAAFNRAVEGAPNFVEARRFRAVLLARAGQLEAASQDINWCLEREPEEGATLYAAACVAARAAEQCGDAKAAQQVKAQAFAFLRRALDRGYGRDKADADPDLRCLRRHPEFRQLLQEQDLFAAQTKRT
jgi:serine/threonine protein kinase/Flp pilus assembly protein TadD